MAGKRSNDTGKFMNPNDPLRIRPDSIIFPPLSSDPPPVSGRMWYRGDVNKLKFSVNDTTVVNVLKEDDPLNIAQISGTNLTPRDWSNDFAKLQNLNVELSTRASEVTLLGVKSQIDKLTFDEVNRLKVQLDSLPNPPSLDVNLSTRASESTLIAMMNRLPASLTTAGNFKVAIIEDAVGLAKSDDISAVQPRNITQWGGVYLTGRDISKDFEKLQNIDVLLSTRASESTLAAINNKLPSSPTAAGNLRMALLETTIKQPIDVQDHWNESVVLLASGARTTSGNSADIDVGRFICGEICVDVTAVSGTNPVLNVYIEGKDRYTGKYKVLFAHENITSVQTIWDTITTLPFSLLRVRWTVSGTSPSFTFSVSGEFKS